MSNTMVTARMSVSKKEAGNRVLESLGINTSQAINELFDYLVANKALPWSNSGSEQSKVSDEALRHALAWVDSLQITLSPEFAQMSIEEARVHRLAKKGW